MDDILPRHMLPPDNPAKCRCETWTYASNMGEWKEGEHHPRCSEGHDQETCECFTCAMKRGDVPRTVHAYGEGHDDTE